MGTALPRIITFIVNPNAKSGEGLKTWGQVRRELKKQGMEEDRQYTVYYTACQGQATEITRELTNLETVKKGEMILILGVIGGDGTLDEVLNGIDCFEHTRVAYIPAGSGNDFSRATGAGNSIEETVRQIASKTPEYMSYDYGRVQITSPLRQFRRFAVSAGIGYDANVCQAIRKSKIKDTFNRLGIGKVAYTVLGLIEVVRCRSVDGWMELDDFERVNFHNMWFVSVHEQPYEGGGFLFAPDANAQDGLLDICLMSDMNRIRFIITLLGILFGNPYMKGAKHYRARKVKVHVNQPRLLHCDGEMMGLQRNAAFKSEDSEFAVVGKQDETAPEWEA